MRVFVTGAAGAVGSYVPQAFADAELVLTARSGPFERLDVADPAAVSAAIGNARPDVVLHLAAATDVDRCQLEPDLAFRSNAIGTHNVAAACAEIGATLVYVSTAGVFPGDKPEPYTEDDEPAPANVYGQSKLAGERAVAETVESSYIVRAGWMIGGAQLDNKFVGKIVDQIAAGATHLRAVDDKFGSPTYAKEMLAGIRQLIDDEPPGLYHLVNEGMVSRYEIALAIRDITGNSKIEVEPVSSDTFPLPAPRARSEAMRNHKLDLVGRNPMRPWREALEEYVAHELLPARRAQPAHA